MTVAGQTFSSAWTYNATTGFKTSETIYGITREFAPDSLGNIASVKQANDKVTQYQYQYGQVRTIWTPEYPIARTINPDGTIASETRAGRATTFTYDKLSRLKGIQPPGGTNATHISYEAVDGALVRVRTTRGTSELVTTRDGFGRPRTTKNTVDVETTLAYDSEGRVVREGYPFKAGASSGGTDIGTVIQYDEIGRVTARINPDGTQTTRTYESGGVVMVRDHQHNPNDRTTALAWQAFGNPDEARLSSVVDAAGHAWSYAYNALGRLVNVSAEGGVTRTWRFVNGTDLLETETHPESGTTTFTYDDAGVLATKTGAKNIRTTYEYDGNDRVKKNGRHSCHDDHL